MTKAVVPSGYSANPCASYQGGTQTQCKCHRCQSQTSRDELVHSARVFQQFAYAATESGAKRHFLATQVNAIVRPVCGQQEPARQASLQPAFGLTRASKRPMGFSRRAFAEANNLLYAQCHRSTSYRSNRLLVASCSKSLVEPFTKIFAPTHHAFSPLVVSEAKSSESCSVVDPDAASFREPVEKGDATVTFAPNTLIWK